ncbi:MAG TPA: T9SS type A sorting domain-containing protein [Bacteroidia bacterium]|nr:T9SS type A sorting domain-containing protein [Bacteroidia bacterium]
MTVSVPSNWTGYQSAHTGNGYAGLTAYAYYYNGSNVNGREYIRGQLYDTLKPGRRYCIEFYASLSDSSFWAVNRLGLYISQSPVPDDAQGDTISVIPQIEFNSASVFTDTMNWIRISGEFIATGGEGFIAIGNFYADSDTDTISHLGNWIWAYYYIDDVAVYEIAHCVAGNNATICYRDSIQLGIIPTPNVLYSWSPTYGLSDPAMANPMASPDTSIVYTLTQIECDVVSTSSITVTIDRGCHTASAIVIPTMLHGDQNIFISGLETNSKFELYDDRGRLIYSAEDYQNDFWSTNLAAGIYIARLTRPDGEQIAKKICVVR